MTVTYKATTGAKETSILNLWSDDPAQPVSTGFWRVTSLAWDREAPAGDQGSAPRWKRMAVFAVRRTKYFFRVLRNFLTALQSGVARHSRPNCSEVWRCITV